MALEPSKDVVRKFAKRLETGIGYHEELLIAVHLKTHQASLETILAEQFVLNTAVLWEVFLSDILLAYLVMSPKRYMKAFKTRMLQSVKDKFGADAARYTKVDLPARPSATLAASFADPKSFNISVNSAETLTRRANDMLAAQHARRFTLATPDAEFVDFLVAMRNFLGHRSESARQRLRETVSPLTAQNARLNSSVANVGAYLKTRDNAGEQRAVYIAKRVLAVAELFA